MTTTKITYAIKVPVVRTFATGNISGTGVRTFEVEEDATIIGGCRAIDEAVRLCKGKEALDLGSPEITPNPASEGFPVT